MTFKNIFVPLDIENDFLLGIIESTNDAIIGEDLQGIIRYWNRSAENLLGYSAKEVLNRSINFILPHDRMSEDKSLINKIVNGEHVEHFDTVRINNMGNLIDVSISISPIFNVEGTLVGISKILRNVSNKAYLKLLAAIKVNAVDNNHMMMEKRSALQSVAEELERSATSIKHIHNSLKKFTVDNLKNLESNAIQIEGVITHLKHSHSKKVVDLVAFETAIRDVETGKVLLDKNQKLLEIAKTELQISLKNLHQSELLLSIANSQALFDVLTKLPNRRLLIDRFNQAMFLSQRNKTYSCLLFIDLDKFKPINDKYGHKAGDLLLIEVAERLKNTIRDTDTVARIGGDEFVILISNLNIDKLIATTTAQDITEKVRERIAMPFTINNDGQTFVINPQCTASIGATVFFDEFGDQSTTLDHILDLSDKAMYQSKKAGGNQIQFSL
jgi:diguanylate cyclase (GGDEF)-like protein/PAS domain S-box-containing protein